MVTETLTGVERLQTALPSVFPVMIASPSKPTVGAGAPALGARPARGNCLSAEQRRIISERVKRESLRTLANEFGVSYETIRRIRNCLKTLEQEAGG